MSGGTGLISLFGLDPQAYEPHPLHAPDRVYRETNCYADVIIELLHARGDEPLAALGCVVRMDFEGDQWTFFKPWPQDLERLYGIDIHEMQPYRPLPEQIAEQLRLGRTLIVELDSWWLPDTAATSYRREHVKTSVAVEAIDIEGRRLRYFHNAGYFELEGEDYRGAFTPPTLPPYVELVRFDAGPRLTGDELRRAAREVTAHHLARRPKANPVQRFGEALAAALPALLEGDAEDYHRYAFATVRMLGSGFEVGAAHVDWLLGPQGTEASQAMARIVEGSKLLSLKLARRRAFDPEPIVSGMAADWELAMTTLDAALA